MTCLGAPPTLQPLPGSGRSAPLSGPRRGSVNLRGVSSEKITVLCDVDGKAVGGLRRHLLADYRKHVLLPEKQFEGFVRPEPTLPKVASHYAEWIDACKGRGRTLADFEYSGWLTESNHLGNVAYRVGKKLVWDAGGMRAKNAPEAEAFLRRDYRQGWSL